MPEIGAEGGLRTCFGRRGQTAGTIPRPRSTVKQGGVFAFAFAFDVALELAGRVQAVTPSPANSPPAPPERHGPFPRQPAPRRPRYEARLHRGDRVAQRTTDAGPAVHQFESVKFRKRIGCGQGLALIHESR
jgi:hypothetical protein